MHEVWAIGQYCLPKVSNGFNISAYWGYILGVSYASIQLVLFSTVGE